MSYNSHAKVRIKNNFPGVAKRITLRHKYSDDLEEGVNWRNVAKGDSTPYYEVSFNTGFIRTGQDYWQLEIEFDDGVVWKNSGWKQCTLTSSDVDKNMTFDANIGKWDIKVPSGNCSTALTASNGYNSMAAVYVENKLPATVQITLKHQYSTGKTYSKKWKNIAAKNKTKDPFYVYFNTGFPYIGLDYWNLEVLLDILPPDGEENLGFPKLVNATKNKECLLQASDVGKSMTFTIDPSGFSINIPSGKCSDYWKSPNGYNSVAFISLVNKSNTMIQKFVLSHQYSSDSIYYFTGGEILANGRADRLMMVEYNTGAGRVGLDYWNIYIVSEDGSLYKNFIENKECYMTQKDSVGIIDFDVSLESFSMNLLSGACDDNMVFVSKADTNLGIDLSKPYNENAYLSAHNAFSSYAYGYIYVQQSLSLRDQLAVGVRTLLLDIYSYSSKGETDIYLFHGSNWPERIVTTAPFGKLFKLSDALKEIAPYIKAANCVITIVFEDGVDTADRPKIMRAFETAGIADRIYTLSAEFENIKDTNWHTLEWMIENKKNLVVFSSDKSGNPFPYQWKYMSENVYGNESTDPATWLNPRSESTGLNTKNLCALNNFPTMIDLKSFDIYFWVNLVASTSTYETLKTHIDGCFEKWGRYPNYLNLNFVTIPDNEPSDAIVYLNNKLHGKASSHKALPLVSDLVRPVIFEERALAKCCSWIDNHFPYYLPPLKEIYNFGIDRILANLANISFILNVLSVTCASNESMLQWISGYITQLKNYLNSMQYVKWSELLDANSSEDLVQWYSFLMMNSQEQQYIPVKKLIKKYADSVLRMNIIEGAHTGKMSALALMGYEINNAIYQKIIKDNISISLDTRLKSTRPDYDLAHIIFAIAHGGTSLNECCVELLPDLQHTLMQGIIRNIYLDNYDLSSELFIAYVFVGGKCNISIENAMARMSNKLYRNKNYFNQFNLENTTCDCDSNNNHCDILSSFDTETHLVLTTLLALAIYQYSNWQNKPLINVSNKSVDYEAVQLINLNPLIGEGALFGRLFQTIKPAIDKHVMQTQELEIENV